jgi:hypothetical protein
LVKETCETYYDTKLIFGNIEDKDLLEDSLMNKLEEYSFAQNKSDDLDKVRYYWAYNLPCTLLVTGSNLDFWNSTLKNIYDMLHKDVLLNVRTAMAAGFKEVIRLIEFSNLKDEQDKEYFINVLNHYLKDSDKLICQKVLPTICDLVQKFDDDKKTELLDSLIKPKIDAIKEIKNGRDGLVLMLEQLFEMFQPIQLLDANFHEYIFDIIKNERAVQYKIRAAKILGSKVVAPLIKGKKYRALLTDFTDELRTSKNFRHRQIYLYIAMSAYEVDNEVFKKHFAKNIGNDMENEPCKCVKIVMAKLCNTVPKDYSKSLEKIRSKLLADGDETVMQHMPTAEEGMASEGKRRYLALNYGSEEESKLDEKMSEEEWLAKEQKEIREVEKTVTIRFANYSTLMRAQILTQGLSAQLNQFMTALGKTTDQDGNSNQTELTRQLLAKAGIKTDIPGADVDQEMAKDSPSKRSLSPDL